LNFFSEHGILGGLRAAEDSGHRLVRPSHVGAAQRKEAVLRNENPRQTKGTSSYSNFRAITV